jgi:hypothetical protein
MDGLIDKMLPDEDWGVVRICLHPQFLPVQSVAIGDFADFSQETSFIDNETGEVILTEFEVTKDSIPAVIDVDYTINNGIITFNEKAIYSVTMTNNAIKSLEFWEWYPVVVTAEIKVGYLDIKENNDFSSKLLIYPNPTKGELQIANYKTALGANQLEINNVEILDIFGRKLMEHKAKDGKQEELNIFGFENGIYFIRVHLNNGEIVVKKVVKQ